MGFKSIKIMKTFTRHLLHYLPLLGILTLAIFGFVAFSYDKNFQAALVVATAVGYVSWGIVHHYLHKDLHLSVVVEYIAISLLGIVFIFSLIFKV